MHAICRCVGMVDEADSKSVASDGVWVRVPPPAPKRRESERDSLLFGGPPPAGNDPLRSNSWEGIPNPLPSPPHAKLISGSDFNLPRCTKKERIRTGFSPFWWSACGWQLSASLKLARGSYTPLSRSPHAEQTIASDSDRPRLSEMSVYCHREPVTDVTGVAIRILKALKTQLFEEKRIATPVCALTRNDVLWGLSTNWGIRKDTPFLVCRWLRDSKDTKTGSVSFPRSLGSSVSICLSCKERS